MNKLKKLNNMSLEQLLNEIDSADYVDPLTRVLANKARDVVNTIDTAMTDLRSDGLNDIADDLYTSVYDSPTDLTQIFKTYADFRKREDKNVNGVSPEFAKRHPDYAKDNETNTGCWCCIDCTRCTRCTRCTDCKYCIGCTGCIDCAGCTRCMRCMDCIDCIDCTGFTGRTDYTNNKVV